MGRHDHTAVIGGRGQLTIPSQIRRTMDLQQGDRVNLIRRGDDIVLRPVRQTLLDLRGSVPVTGPQDFSAVRRQVQSERVRRAIDD